MVANSKQKLKLLYLYKILDEETDSEQGLTMAQIITKLNEQGIGAERKGIYRDIKVLRDFGLEITTIPRVPVQYTMNRTGMSLTEINLLIDAVQGSKFLSERTSKHLVKSITGLVSERERKLLKKTVHVEGRIKTQNDSVFHSIDIIHEAMRDKKKIEFLYFKYDAKMKRAVQHDGKPYVHTPVKLIFSDGFYYLVTWSDNHSNFVTFRIDRMRLVQVSELAATKNERIANFAFENFESQAFGMFDGETVRAHLKVEADAMDVIADRFGRDVVTKPHKDGSADVTVTVRKSPQFFGWVAGMNGAVTIAQPKPLKDEYRDWLKSLADSLG